MGRPSYQDLQARIKELEEKAEEPSTNPTPFRVRGHLKKIIRSRDMAEVHRYAKEALEWL